MVEGDVKARFEQLRTPSPTASQLRLTRTSLASPPISQATFKQLDSDSSGSISISELKALLTEVSSPLSDDAFKTLAQRLDKNGDGQIQYKEFAAWYFASEVRGVPPPPPRCPFRS